MTIIMNVKSTLYFILVICLVISMVAEACQESGTLYTGSTYNGYGDIYHKNLTSGPYVSLCDITPPWGGTLTDELLTEDVPKTYSSGTERYVITMHDAFIGAETKSAEFKECWYTEDGNRYVKTSGSNSALGNNWANAWLTVGYGFQNIPSGKDLYVEEGLYGGETLSNLNPPQTMKMYIQPSGHTESQCNVWVNDDTAFTSGSFATSEASTLGTYQTTVIDTSLTISDNGRIHAFYIAPKSGRVSDIKFKIFRSSGTQYLYIGESDWFQYPSTPSVTGYDFNICNIQVQSGDIIGVTVDGGVSGDNTQSNSVLRYKSGIQDVTYDTLKSDWSSIISGKLNLGARGFK